MAPPTAQSDWIYGISDAPMSGYTDDTVNPASLVKFVTSDQQAADYQVITANNEGHSTGNDWATEQWTEKHDVNIPFNINPSILMLVRLLTAFMGVPVVSSPAVGVTKEVFTPQDAANRQHPAYWLGEKCKAAHDALYPSCVGEKATFSGNETGKLSVQGNFRGSGKQTLGANLPITPETNKYYLKNTMSKVVRATAAIPATPVKTYQCGLQSWMFDVDNANNQNVGYDPGCARYFAAGDEDSGIIRSYHPFGRRKYTGQFAIWLENSAPELALLRSQSPLNLKMGMYGKTISTTYKNMLEIEMHLALYKTVTIGQKEGFNLLQISPDAFYDETANKIVSITTQHPTVV